jgi:hypothetical protein
MLLETPTEISSVIYEGSLQFDPLDVEKLGYRGAGEPELPSPTIGIGQPQWWNLAELMQESGKSLPAEIKLLLDEADFYLVRLACSFRPTRASQVEWARFTAYLRPKLAGADPIAYDIYPREIQDEAKTDVKVSISPSLKLVDKIEASLGGVEFAIQYQKIEPAIIGTGVLESNPGWDFSRTNKYPVVGAKFLHLVVKRPRSAEAVRATFDLQAQVKTHEGILRATVDQKAAHLSVVMCS